MNDLKVDFENCYGIKKLSHEFSFVEHHTQLVYAPNGMMKSSFALTMKGLFEQGKNKPKDRLHPERNAKYDVTSNGTALTKEQIFVADPEDKTYDTSKLFNTFLADSELKARYDTIYENLKEYIARVIIPLKDVSISSDCEDELYNTFNQGPGDTIFAIMERLANDVNAHAYTNYGFKYNSVFDKGGKVKLFLEKNAADLNEYVKKYNELIAQSKIFGMAKGHTFGTYQANELQKALANDDFFMVDHKLTLNTGESIDSINKLKEVFEKAKKDIIDDKNLRDSFDKITKAVDSNNEVRLFKDVIMKQPEIIVELLDYENFRRKTWKGYLSDEQVKQHLLDYSKYFKSQKKELQDIINQAREQLPVWRNIIRVYNDRFFVPFEVEIENQDDIILKQSAAKLKFNYIDDQNQRITKGKDEMLSILSRGEQRAFYILQLLFDLEARKQSGIDQLIIFDDIADSFDYQNKYAIIEYLHDLDSTASNMHMIVLTHNFDFYRTLASRLGLGNTTWMAVKKDDGAVVLNKGGYQRDLFSYFSKKASDDKIFISMIPFVRNLVEYTEGNNDTKYEKLTSCLHLKIDTKSITEDDVITIVKGFTKGAGCTRPTSTNKIYDLIMQTASAINQETAPNEILIENKIVLSIACRLKAEEYLKKRLIELGETEASLAVTSVQTAAWTKKLKNTCPNDPQISVVERVNMMTPEFIHINSFMYEPLIDLSIHHLKRLYQDCSGL